MIGDWRYSYNCVLPCVLKYGGIDSCFQWRHFPSDCSRWMELILLVALEVTESKAIRDEHTHLWEMCSENFKFHTNVLQKEELSFQAILFHSSRLIWFLNPMNEGEFFTLQGESLQENLIITLKDVSDAKKSLWNVPDLLLWLCKASASNNSLSPRILWTSLGS